MGRKVGKMIRLMEGERNKGKERDFFFQKYKQMAVTGCIIIKERVFCK